MSNAYPDGTYGLCRVAVDAAKQLGVSPEGLKAQGGWTVANYGRKESRET